MLEQGNARPTSISKSLFLGAVVGFATFLGLEGQHIMDARLAALGGFTVGSLAAYTSTTLGTDRDWFASKPRGVAALASGLATLGITGIAFHGIQTPEMQNYVFDFGAALLPAAYNAIGPARKRIAS